METVYLVILCLALAATLAFGALYVYDRFVAREQPRWGDGALERVLVMFPVAAVGLLIGLLLSRSRLDLVDLGAEAMLLAAGGASSERIAARRRRDGNRDRPAVLGVCLAAGLVGGLAGLGS